MAIDPRLGMPQIAILSDPRVQAQLARLEALNEAAATIVLERSQTYTSQHSKSILGQLDEIEQQLRRRVVQYEQAKTLLVNHPRAQETLSFLESEIEQGMARFQQVTAQLPVTKTSEQAHKQLLTRVAQARQTAQHPPRAFEHPIPALAFWLPQLGGGAPLKDALRDLNASVVQLPPEQRGVYQTNIQRMFKQIAEHGLRDEPSIPSMRQVSFGEGSEAEAIQIRRALEDELGDTSPEGIRIVGREALQSEADLRRRKPTVSDLREFSQRIQAVYDQIWKRSTMTPEQIMGEVSRIQKAPKHGLYQPTIQELEKLGARGADVGASMTGWTQPTHFFTQQLRDTASRALAERSLSEGSRPNQAIVAGWLKALNPASELRHFDYQRQLLQKEMAQATDPATLAKLERQFNNLNEHRRFVSTQTSKRQRRLNEAFERGNYDFLAGEMVELARSNFEARELQSQRVFWDDPVPPLLSRGAAYPEDPAYPSVDPPNKQNFLIGRRDPAGAELVTLLRWIRRARGQLGSSVNFSSEGWTSLVQRHPAFANLTQRWELSSDQKNQLALGIVTRHQDPWILRQVLESRPEMYRQAYESWEVQGGQFFGSVLEGKILRSGVPRPRYTPPGVVDEQTDRHVRELTSWMTLNQRWTGSRRLGGTLGDWANLVQEHPVFGTLTSLWELGQGEQQRFAQTLARHSDRPDRVQEELRALSDRDVELGAVFHDPLGAALGELPSAWPAKRKYIGTWEESLLAPRTVWMRPGLDQPNIEQVAIEGRALTPAERLFFERRGETWSDVRTVATQGGYQRVVSATSIPTDVRGRQSRLDPIVRQALRAQRSSQLHARLSNVNFAADRFQKNVYLFGEAMRMATPMLGMMQQMAEAIDPPGIDPTQQGILNPITGERVPLSSLLVQETPRAAQARSQLQATRIQELTRHLEQLDLLRTGSKDPVLFGNLADFGASLEDPTQRRQALQEKLLEVPPDQRPSSMRNLLRYIEGWDVQAAEATTPGGRPTMVHLPGFQEGQELLTGLLEQTPSPSPYPNLARTRQTWAQPLVRSEEYPGLMQENTRFRDTGHILSYLYFLYHAGGRATFLDSDMEAPQAPGKHRKLTVGRRDFFRLLMQRLPNEQGQFDRIKIKELMALRGKDRRSYLSRLRWLPLDELDRLTPVMDQVTDELRRRPVLYPGQVHRLGEAFGLSAPVVAHMLRTLSGNNFQYRDPKTGKQESEWPLGSFQTAFTNFGGVPLALFPGYEMQAFAYPGRFQYRGGGLYEQVGDLTSIPEGIKRFAGSGESKAFNIFTAMRAPAAKLPMRMALALSLAQRFKTYPRVLEQFKRDYPDDWQDQLGWLNQELGRWSVPELGAPIHLGDLTGISKYGETWAHLREGGVQYPELEAPSLPAIAPPPRIQDWTGIFGQSEATTHYVPGQGFYLNLDRPDVRPRHVGLITGDPITRESLQDFVTGNRYASYMRAVGLHLASQRSQRAWWPAWQQVYQAMAPGERLSDPSGIDQIDMVREFATQAGTLALPGQYQAAISPKAAAFFTDPEHGLIARFRPFAERSLVPIVGLRQQGEPQQILAAQLRAAHVNPNNVNVPFLRGGSGALDLDNLVKGLPELQPGLVRLFRGEAAPSKTNLDSWIYRALEESGALGAEGRWYTRDPEEALWYTRDAGEGSRLVYQDIPEDIATLSHLANPVFGDRQAKSFSRRWDKEWFLPEEYSGKGMPFARWENGQLLRGSSGAFPYTDPGPGGFDPGFQNLKWTQEQQTVIEATDRFIRLTAGPGAGKTQTSVGWLVNQFNERLSELGTIPRFLLLARTKAAVKSANQMITNYPGIDKKGPVEALTWDQLAYDQVARHAQDPRLGVDLTDYLLRNEENDIVVDKRGRPRLRILPDSDIYLRRIMDDMGIPQDEMHYLGQAVHRIMNLGVDPRNTAVLEDYFETLSGRDDTAYSVPLMRQAAAIYGAYESALGLGTYLGAPHLDFPKLRRLFGGLLKNPRSGGQIRENFGALVVDEAQMLGREVWELVRMLNGPKTKLLMAMDPNQAMMTNVFGNWPHYNQLSYLDQVVGAMSAQGQPTGLPKVQPYELTQNQRSPYNLVRYVLNAFYASQGRGQSVQMPSRLDAGISPAEQFRVYPMPEMLAQTQGVFTPELLHGIVAKDIITRLVQNRELNPLDFGVLTHTHAASQDFVKTFNKVAEAFGSMLPVGAKGFPVKAWSPPRETKTEGFMLERARLGKTDPGAFFIEEDEEDMLQPPDTIAAYPLHRSGGANLKHVYYLTSAMESRPFRQTASGRWERNPDFFGETLVALSRAMEDLVVGYHTGQGGNLGMPSFLSGLLRQSRQWYLGDIVRAGGLGQPMARRAMGGLLFPNEPTLINENEQETVQQTIPANLRYLDVPEGRVVISPVGGRVLQGASGSDRLNWMQKALEEVGLGGIVSPEQFNTLRAAVLANWRVAGQSYRRVENMNTPFGREVVSGNPDPYLIDRSGKVESDLLEVGDAFRNLLPSGTSLWAMFDQIRGRVNTQRREALRLRRGGGQEIPRDNLDLLPIMRSPRENWTQKALEEVGLGGIVSPEQYNTLRTAVLAAWRLGDQSNRRLSVGREAVPGDPDPYLSGRFEDARERLDQVRGTFRALLPKGRDSRAVVSELMLGIDESIKAQRAQALRQRRHETAADLPPALRSVSSIPPPAVSLGGNQGTVQFDPTGITRPPPAPPPPPVAPVSGNRSVRFDPPGMANWLVSQGNDFMEGIHAYGYGVRQSGATGQWLLNTQPYGAMAATSDMTWARVTPEGNIPMVDEALAAWQRAGSRGPLAFLHPHPNSPSTTQPSRGRGQDLESLFTPIAEYVAQRLGTNTPEMLFGVSSQASNLWRAQKGREGWKFDEEVQAFAGEIKFSGAGQDQLRAALRSELSPDLKRIVTAFERDKARYEEETRGFLASLGTSPQDLPMRPFYTLEEYQRAVASGRPLRPHGVDRSLVEEVRGPDIASSVFERNNPDLFTGEPSRVSPSLGAPPGGGPPVSNAELRRYAGFDSGQGGGGQGGGGPRHRGLTGDWMSAYFAAMDVQWLTQAFAQPLQESVEFGPLYWYRRYQALRPTGVYQPQPGESAEQAARRARGVEGEWHQIASRGAQQMGQAVDVYERTKVASLLTPMLTREPLDITSATRRQGQIESLDRLAASIALQSQMLNVEPENLLRQVTHLGVNVGHRPQTIAGQQGMYREIMPIVSRMLEVTKGQFEGVDIRDALQYIGPALSTMRGSSQEQASWLMSVLTMGSLQNVPSGIMGRTLRHLAEQGATPNLAMQYMMLAGEVGGFEKIPQAREIAAGGPLGAGALRSLGTVITRPEFHEFQKSLLQMVEQIEEMDLQITRGLPLQRERNKLQGETLALEVKQLDLERRRRTGAFPIEYALAGAQISLGQLQLAQSRAQAPLERRQLGLQAERGQLQLEMLGELQPQQLALAQLQLQATPLQNQLASFGWQQQILSLRQSIENIELTQRQNRAYYGEVGAPRTRGQYLAWEKAWTQAQYSGRPEQALQMNLVPGMGLQDRQFFASQEYQRSMIHLQTGGPAARAQVYYEQMKYLDKQTQFYEEQRQLEDERRQVQERQAFEQRDLMQQQLGVFEGLVPMLRSIQDLKLVMDTIQTGFLPRQQEIDKKLVELDLALVGVKQEFLAPMQQAEQVVAALSLDLKSVDFSTLKQRYDLELASLDVRKQLNVVEDGLRQVEDRRLATEQKFVPLYEQVLQNVLDTSEGAQRGMGPFYGKTLDMRTLSDMIGTVLGGQPSGQNFQTLAGLGVEITAMQGFLAMFKNPEDRARIMNEYLKTSMAGLTEAQGAYLLTPGSAQAKMQGIEISKKISIAEAIGDTELVRWQGFWKGVERLVPATMGLGTALLHTTKLLEGVSLAIVALTLAARLRDFGGGGRGIGGLMGCAPGAFFTPGTPLAGGSGAKPGWFKGALGKIASVAPWIGAAALIGSSTDFLSSDRNETFLRTYPDVDLAGLGQIGEGFPSEVNAGLLKNPRESQSEKSSSILDFMKENSQWGLTAALLAPQLFGIGKWAAQKGISVGGQVLGKGTAVGGQLAGWAAGQFTQAEAAVLPRVLGWGSKLAGYGTTALELASRGLPGGLPLFIPAGVGAVAGGIAYGGAQLGASAIGEGEYKPIRPEFYAGRFTEFGRAIEDVRGFENRGTNQQKPVQSEFYPLGQLIRQFKLDQITAQFQRSNLVHEEDVWNNIQNILQSEDVWNNIQNTLQSNVTETSDVFVEFKDKLVSQYLVFDNLHSQSSALTNELSNTTNQAKRAQLGETLITIQERLKAANQQMNDLIKKGAEQFGDKVNVALVDLQGAVKGHAEKIRELKVREEEVWNGIQNSVKRTTDAFGNAADSLLNFDSKIAQRYASGGDDQGTFRQDLKDWKQDSEKFYRALVNKIAKEEQVDPALIKAIIRAESNWNPQAVSSAGARGLMQLMPGLAASLGLSADIPEENIRGGIQYLKMMLRTFNNELLPAIAAYNAGPGAVALAGGEVPNILETQTFVQNVSRFYQEEKAARDVVTDLTSGVGESLTKIAGLGEKLDEQTITLLKGGYDNLYNTTSMAYDKLIDLTNQVQTKQRDLARAQSGGGGGRQFGGYVQAGQAYTVGEVGPEMFVPFGGFRAVGGSVLGGRGYVVGEGGPELFVPGNSGMVLSNASMDPKATSGVTSWMASTRRTIVEWGVALRETSSLVEGLEGGIGAEKVFNWFRSLREGMTAISGALKGLASLPTTTEVQTTSQALGDWFRQAGVSAGGVVQGVNAGKQEADKFSKPLADAIKLLADQFPGWVNFISSQFVGDQTTGIAKASADAGTFSGDPLTVPTKALTNHFPGWVEYITQQFVEDATTGIAKASVDAASNSGDRITQPVRGVTNHFPGWVEYITQQFVEDATTGIAKATSDVAGNSGERITKPVRGVTGHFPGWVEYITQQYVEDATTGIAKASVDAGRNSGSRLTGAVAQVTGAFPGWVEYITQQYVEDARTGIAKAATDAGKNSGDRIVNAVAEVTSAFPGWVEYITKQFEEALKQAKGRLGVSGSGIDNDPMMGYRQFGGLTLPRGSYLVGERGPEIFAPSVVGNIIPTLSLPEQIAKVVESTINQIPQLTLTQSKTTSGVTIQGGITIYVTGRLTESEVEGVKTQLIEAITEAIEEIQ